MTTYFTVIVTSPFYSYKEDCYTLDKTIKNFSNFKDVCDYLTSLDSIPHKVSIHFNIH